jgi:predicted DNA-binding ribbon-helix-helix protein
MILKIGAPVRSRCVAHHEMADLLPNLPAVLSGANSKSTVWDKGGLAGSPMRSSICKRSIVIGGHKTSVSLEDAFWSDLKHIAHTQEASLSELIAKIDETRQQGNLSSAIRLFVLEHFRSRGGL